MKHIVLCRIDDRLIHGQVVTAWVKQTEGNRIVIIDEALVKDVFLQKIIKAAAPSDIRIDIYNIENGVQLIIHRYMLIHDALHTLDFFFTC